MTKKVYWCESCERAWTDDDTCSECEESGTHAGWFETVEDAVSPSEALGK